MSFLPELDVERIIGYAAGQGKRSLAAAVPDNAYGTVVEAAFKQTVARRGGRVVVLERYPQDRTQLQAAVRNVAQAATRADAIFIPDGADTVPAVVQALTANGIDPRNTQLLGSGLWDDPQIFSNSVLDGAWYAAPDSNGFRNFSARYRTRTARTRPAPPRSPTTRWRSSPRSPRRRASGASRKWYSPTRGFTGIDGLFRFRPDGTNQRGLAVMKVTPTGGQIISPAPKSFTGSAT